MSEKFAFAEAGVEGFMTVSPTGRGHVYIGGTASYKGFEYNFRFDVDALKDWSDWPSAYGNYVKACWGQSKAYDTPIPKTYFEPFKAAVLAVAKASGKWSPEIERSVTLTGLSASVQHALQKCEEAEKAMKAANDEFNAAVAAFDKYHAKGA